MGKWDANDPLLIAVQLAELRKDLVQLRSSLGVRRQEIVAYMEEGDQNLQDPYVQMMLPFIKEADKHVKRQEDQLTQAEHMYKDTLKFYGEYTGPKLPGSVTSSMPSESFFGIFAEFVTAYQKCRQDNEKWAVARRLEQQRNKETERLRREAAQARTLDPDAQASQNLLDNVLQSLQASSLSSGRRHRREREHPSREGLPRSPHAPPMSANLEDDSEGMAAQLLAELNPDLAASYASKTSSRTHDVVCESRPAENSNLQYSHSEAISIDAGEPGKAPASTS